MPSAAPARAAVANDPNRPTSNDSQTSSTNASSAPPPSAALAAIPAPAPNRKSWKAGSAVFDIKMNPYILPEHGTAALYDSVPQTQPTSPSPGLNPYHDGRIRNAVPSKLKGKTSGKQGNFSVLQMNIQKPQMTERDIAAQRTSEGTAAAARLASAQGYRHPRRPRPSPTIPPSPHSPPLQPSSYSLSILPTVLPILQPPPFISSPAVPQDRSSEGPSVVEEPSAVEEPPTGDELPMGDDLPIAHEPSAADELPTGDEIPAAEEPATVDELSAATEATQVTDTERRNDPEPSDPPLPPSDVKKEQARLLTLLRSLHPVIVADRICKALAHLGGIPGAPPPSDGVFPQSLTNNGPGDLFISWISEVFPHVEPTNQAPGVRALPPLAPAGPVADPAPIPAPAPAHAPTSAIAKRRGRPKGTKNGAPRKDKGTKKKEVPSSGTVETNETPNTQPSSTAEVPQSTITSAQSSDISQLITTNNQNSDIPQPSTTNAENTTAVPQVVSTARRKNPTGRKRGRPKGSKNRTEARNITQFSTAFNFNTLNPPQPSASAVGSPLADQTTPGHPDTGPSSTSEATGANTNQVAANENQTETSSSLRIIHESGTEGETNSSGPQLLTANGQDSAQGASRKRKNSDQSSQTNALAEAVVDAPQASNAAVPPANNIQAQQAKRRRVPQETKRRNPVTSETETQLTSAEATASPEVAEVKQSLSASNSLDSQTHSSMVGDDSNHGVQQIAPRPQQQLQQQNLHMQQLTQNQQHQPKQQAQLQHQHHGQQQQSPDKSSEQSSQSSQMPSPAVNRPRSLLPGGPGRTPTNMTAQAFYQQQQQQQQRRQQQRQMANQFRHAAEGSLTRAMGSSSPTQFPGFGGQQSLSQQGHQSQLQSTGPAPTANMSQFQDFGGSNYPGLNYPINSGVTDPYGNHSQIETDMPDGIYHPMGRE
ncbi:hypothetical protein NW762_001062 [Fusarium torreyae]|uniref:Uncharacterized protein n=1 Tax=Fusarium torreyae TaxID=1237075 RepID=A0A9W8SID7_9HYPO|nr:hypothetical protein NW762_001062 [Fusarium torreyae]